MKFEYLIVCQVLLYKNTLAIDGQGEKPGRQEDLRKQLFNSNLMKQSSRIAAFKKVVKTIASCKTWEQIDVAHNMATCYSKQYHDLGGLLLLHQLCTIQYKIVAAR